MVQPLDPENSLDTTAAAGASTTTSTNRIIIPTQSPKRALRTTRTEPASSKAENNGDLNSRSRRHSLRNTFIKSSDTPPPTNMSSKSHSNLRSTYLSSYSTPDRPENTSSGKFRTYKDRVTSKSSISKIVSLSPSPAPHEPIMYDTIEVMLAPPPEYMAEEPNTSSVKRRGSKGPTRRSKRMKLDEGEDLELDYSIVEPPSRRRKAVQQSQEIQTQSEAMVQEVSAKYDEQPVQMESVEPTEHEKMEEDTHEELDMSKETVIPEVALEESAQENVSSFVEWDIPPIDSSETTHPPEPETTKESTVEVTSPRIPSAEPMDIRPLPSALEQAQGPLNPPSSAGKSHEPTEDINDWLMTDVEQSVEDDTVVERQVTPLQQEESNLDTLKDEVPGPAVPAEDIVEEVKVDGAEIEPKEDAQIAKSEVAPAEDSVEASTKVLRENVSQPSSTEESEEQDSDAFVTASEDKQDADDADEDSGMDLDVEPSKDILPEETQDEVSKVTPLADPIAALIDESRMSMSGSIIDSPSPPLRTILPKPLSKLVTTSTPTPPPQETPSTRETPKPDTELGEFQETPDEFARSTMAMRAESSKQTSMSPFPKFDVPELPTIRSTRASLERRAPVAQSIDMSSANVSRLSTPLSAISLPTPPGRSPSPAVSRVDSPSFGLRTTPRPIGRPPSRPSRGGLRHVNHDSDARSKLLMARPKTAIPTHIDPAEYARECIEAAMSSRLPPYALDSAEHKFLRTHINYVQVTTYLNIRNGILRLWMLNPTIAVCREEALGVAKEDRHMEMAAKCHEFLVRNGFINFGCIEPTRPLSRAVEMMREKSYTVMKRRKRVVIIGAGAAGLGCARQLENLFQQFADRFPRNEELPEVVILEGRNRVGGRIYSYPLVERPSSSNSRAGVPSTRTSMSTLSSFAGSSFAGGVGRFPEPAVDLGAQIVTGFDNGNPLAPIVKRQLRLRWHHLHDDSLLFNDLDGERVDRTEDVRAERLFNDILDRASSLKERPKEQPLIEGDRELMDQGKEPHGESGRQIAKVEENEAILPPMPPSPPLSAAREMNSNLASPRPSSNRHRIPARRALTKLGFKLKDGETKAREDVDFLSTHNTLGDTMRSILLDIQDLVDLSPMDLKLLNWHWANLEYGNATNLNKLSLKHWDQDDGNEFLGAHAMILGGYGQLANGLASTPTPLNIRFNQSVQQITYSRGNRRTPELDDSPVTVICDSGEIVQADAVVVTASLGVLKSGMIAFDPELPDRKQSAISRLGFGLLNKVVLVYDRPFWDTEADVIGCLRTPKNGDLKLQDTYQHDRGRFYLIWNCTPSCGRPTLVALMAGDAAFQTEQESDDSLINEMTAILARIHHKDVLPRPSHAIVSRWRKDPFARGSYSFVGPDATGEDYDILGEPVEQKVFFAGEATCRTHPATVHGAYMSGLRVASEILEAFIGKIEMPPDDVLIPKKNHPIRNPLIEQSSIPSVRRRTDPESDRYKARNIKRARFSKIVEECQNRIVQELGPKPVAPKKYHPNAFLLFQKDKWDIAKYKAKDKYGDRPDSVDSVTRDDVRASMGRMWRDLPEDEKKVYLDKVEEEKAQFKRDLATFGARVQAWERAVARIKEETKQKIEDVDLTSEEKALIQAAREEEQLEIAAKEERENLRKFYGEVGIDCLFSDEEEDKTEDLYLQSDDAVLDQMLRRLG